jgi:hypothetical protein
MWEPQLLTTLRASKACRGKNFILLYPDIRVFILEPKLLPIFLVLLLEIKAVGQNLNIIKPLRK